MLPGLAAIPNFIQNQSNLLYSLQKFENLHHFIHNTLAGLQLTFKSPSSVLQAKLILSLISKNCQGQISESEAQKSIVQIWVIINYRLKYKIRIWRHKHRNIRSEFEVLDHKNKRSESEHITQK